MDKKKLKWIVGIVILAVIIALPFVTQSSYLRSLITSICIYSIFAISYDLLLGYTGIASFGHAIYFGLGAYILAYTTVRLQLQLTDPDLKSRDRVVKKSDLPDLFSAIDMGSIWLMRALSGK